MISFFRKIFKTGPSPDFEVMVRNGATIIDVRTKSEFQSGHIPGSVNIPLNDLPSKIKSIKKEKEIITCCASGIRSASAKKMLRSSGFEKVYNGGGWQSLRKKLKK